MVLLAISLVPVSSMRRWLLRLICNYRVDPGATVEFGALIDGDEVTLSAGSRVRSLAIVRVGRISLGRGALIDRGARIHVNSLTMGPRSTIGARTEIAGDRRDARSTIEMGMYSWVFQDCYVNVARPVVLGRNVGVGGGSFIFSHGFWLSKLDGFPVSFGPVRIDDDAWLPWGCFVMPGVTIGKRVVIGARSVVNKHIPDDALAAGVPAKIIRERSSREVSWPERFEMLREVTEEMAVYEGAQLTCDSSERGVTYCFGSERVVHVMLEAPDDRWVPDRSVLTLVPSVVERSTLESAACVSLVNYHSSPQDSIPVAGQRWLAFARRIGFRHYPIDELDS